MSEPSGPKPTRFFAPAVVVINFVYMGSCILPAYTIHHNYFLGSGPSHDVYFGRMLLNRLTMGFPPVWLVVLPNALFIGGLLLLAKQRGASAGGVGLLALVLGVIIGIWLIGLGAVHIEFRMGGYLWWTSLALLTTAGFVQRAWKGESPKGIGQPPLEKGGE